MSWSCLLRQACGEGLAGSVLRWAQPGRRASALPLASSGATYKAHPGSHCRDRQSSAHGPSSKIPCGVQSGSSPFKLVFASWTQLWPNLWSLVQGFPECASLWRSCGWELQEDKGDHWGCVLCKGFLTGGELFPGDGSDACSSGARLLQDWRAAVLVDDPEEADPPFPPTENPLPVHPGATGKAGGSPEPLLTAEPCTGTQRWGSCVPSWSSFMSLPMPLLFVSAEKASPVRLAARHWMMVSCVAKQVSKVAASMPAAFPYSPPVARKLQVPVPWLLFQTLKMGVFGRSPSCRRVGGSRGVGGRRPAPIPPGVLCPSPRGAARCVGHGCRQGLTCWSCEGPFSSSLQTACGCTSYCCPDHRGNNSSGEINYRSHFIILRGWGVAMALAASFTQSVDGRQLRARAGLVGVMALQSLAQHGAGSRLCSCASAAGCTEPSISVPLYRPGSPAPQFLREQREQGLGSVAGVRIRASLRAACAARGIPPWPGVPGHLSPPGAACQTPACMTRCPYKGRQKLKGALSARFLPPFRPFAQPRPWLQPSKTWPLLCRSWEGPRTLFNCGSPVLSVGMVGAWWPPSIALTLVPCADFHGKVCWGAGPPASWEHQPGVHGWG